MIFAPTCTRQERTLVGRLRLLGFDAEDAIHPRREFREALRDRLVDEAADQAA